VVLTAAKSSGIWENLAFHKLTEVATKLCWEFPEFFDFPKMSKNRNLSFQEQKIIFVWHTSCSLPSRRKNPLKSSA